MKKTNSKLKIITLFGTRPEIIRLSRIINKFDFFFKNILVNTNQNFSYELNEIFFKDLNIRKPDYSFKKSSDGIIEKISYMLREFDVICKQEKPDACLLLGDTNTSLLSYVCKRLKIPIFHIEAGNRSFDLRVPEEINRKIVDHLSDVNLTYSQISKANLLRENIDPDRVIFIGSPLKEVFQFYKKKINKSKILSALKIKKFNYFLISFHREENIDSEDNFKDFIKLLSFLKSEFKIPIVVSTHFRLNQKLKNTIIKNKLTDIIFMKPFSYSDYCKLQLNSKMIFSDSGSLTEETSIMRLKSINIRDSQERHEGFEDGIVPLTGLNLKLIKNAIYYLLSNKNKITPVSDYERGINISSKLVTIIISFVDQINKKSWFKK
jgi:UDP-N-acetylglucosamine 2-epimerase|tara:strand:- start:1604 stop:2740 length:1137 start_codon:yes stop_codon:yes gene_type:complete